MVRVLRSRLTASLGVSVSIIGPLSFSTRRSCFDTGLRERLYRRREGVFAGLIELIQHLGIDGSQAQVAIITGITAIQDDIFVMINKCC
jgi:hypothetical protein